MTFRKEYTTAELIEDTVCSEPFAQFEQWFSEYLSTHSPEPFAMVLASATAQGAPSVRTVLLRTYGVEGFVFYTNYQSQKGKELIENPFASLLFYWPELERQVRVSGKVEKLSPEESDKYFQTRPRGSQIGAIASTQSQTVLGREELDRRYREVELQYGEKQIPCPVNWGGFRVIPESFEFWQGRENRMHDRILYKAQNASWTISRLAP